MISIAPVMPYFLLAALVGSAAVMLTSKRLCEKFVAAGMLPRAFLGVIPVLQTVIRIFGGVLIAIGITRIGIDSGWIDENLLARYAFPGSLILLGAILLFLNRRD